ncbi:MAG: PIN domain-containing protein [Bacteroidales bacterium]|nr:PIN domain-containing protein [Bacteroidales bacterium]
MKITVDSNIVFSAILNTRSNIGQILTIGSKYFDFYTIDLLKTEILNHKTKIQNITGFSDADFYETYNLINSKIRLVDDKLIPEDVLKLAYNLTYDIDEKDTVFVALNNHLKSKLWTGDKMLINGLISKGYSGTITTAELYEIFISKVSQNM